MHHDAPEPKVVRDYTGSAKGPEYREVMPKVDNPVEPAHYTALDPEPLDVIDSWGLPFYEAQVLKYLARAGRKYGEKYRREDLQKAAFYLNRRINQLGG